VNPESNDEQLERARREIRAQAALLHERPLQARTPPPATRAADSRIEPSRRDYRIGELTGVHYRAFVEQAFHALLKRAPALAESEAQIALLATGATKAEVLGNLRWSSEGRRIGARVAGLLPRYATAKARRIPLLGYLIDLGLNLAALPQLARHQRASDALMAAADEAAAVADQALTRRLDELGAAHNRRLDELGAARDLLRQRIDDLHAYAHELSDARDALTRTLHGVEIALHARIDQFNGAQHAFAARLDELEDLRRRLHGMTRWSDALDAAFVRIDAVAAERTSRQRRDAEQTALAMVAADTLRDSRNADWATRFGDGLAPRARVLVLACDADWSRCLAAAGLDVVNPPAASPADDAGLSAHELLMRGADASLDGVSILALPALARELPLIELLAEVRRILRPGGLLLLAFARETVAVLDSLRGVPATALAPELLEHALSSAGFADSRRVDGIDGTVALLARKAVA
jgi:hypothetical protein